MYVYLYSLRVSGNHVPIVRRINCINAISGICHSVWTTVWYAGWDETAVSFQPDGRPYRVTCTRYRIDTVNSPDDGHMVVRNTYRIEINIHEKFVRQVGLFTKVRNYVYGKYFLGPLFSTVIRALSHISVLLSHKFSA